MGFIAGTRRTLEGYASARRRLPPKANEAPGAQGPFPARAVVPMGKSNGSTRKPNIVFVMADDVGWFNIGAYHRGMMAGRTPNLDRLAAGGMLFTDYYAEASCTAGRANFITGQLPIRTGLTTVGQAGAHIGLPAEAPTIATVLKSMGYATGQFGKNHLGDRNEFLPTVHGFDEFFGYLYHLDAMEDPAHPNYPPELIDKIGPRNMVHSWATDTRRPDRRAALGQDRQAADRGCRHALSQTDGDRRRRDPRSRPQVRRQGRRARASPSSSGSTRRACTSSPTSPRSIEKLRTPENGWSLYEAGMAQLDDIVGAVMKKLDDMGVAEDTIVVFTTDNGAENFTWPDGGQTPFAGGKGTVMEGGFRVPCILRWPGKVPAGKVENGIISGLDWFPTFVAAAGNPHIVEELKQGKNARRDDVQGAPRRLRPDGLHHGQRPIEAARDLLLRRRPRSAPYVSTTTSTGSSISRTAGSAAPSRSTGRSSATCASIPSSGRG